MTQDLKPMCLISKATLKRLVNRHNHDFGFDEPETIEALTQDLSGMRLVQDWQPIETAPSDIEFLLYCPNRGITNEERAEIGFYRNTKAGTQHAWATHWMPLPAAPKPEEK